MNMTPIVLLVCLLALHECSAEDLLHGRRQYSGLSRRQDSDTSQCNSCRFPTGNALDKVSIAISQIGYVITDVKKELLDIFNITFDTQDELQEALEDTLKFTKEQTDDLLKSFSLSLHIIKACPPLQTLFEQLNRDLNDFLELLTNNWKQFATGGNPNDVYPLLAKALALDIDVLFRLLRNLMIRAVDALLPVSECKNIAPAIYAILDPNGDLSRAISAKLNAEGDNAITIAKNMLGSLIPGAVAGGGLDIVDLLEKLLCGALRAKKAVKDYSEFTKGLCPNIPEEPDFTPIVLKALCGIVDIGGRNTLPSEFSSTCA